MAGGIDTGDRSGRRSWKPRAEINVTPFVDVMLVLLIVFMITAPLLTVGVEELIPRLRAIAGTGSDARVYIRADEGAPYGDVMRVLARVSSAGYGDLGLVTDPDRE